MVLIEKFEAQSANGKRYTICKYQDFVQSNELDDDEASMIPKGSATLRTSDGKNVTNNENGTYTIVPLNLRVQRITPKKITK